MIKEREYLLSVDEINRPVVLEGQQAVAMLLLRLILQNPGTDPLHPLRGVGIINYRYAMGKLDELKKRVKDQIRTYIPDFQYANVDIEITDDKLCNIVITNNEELYKYESSSAPIPISIEDLEDN